MARRTTLKIQIESIKEDAEPLSLIELSEILCLLELTYLSAVEDDDEQQEPASLSLAEFDAEENTVVISITTATKPAMSKVNDAIVEEDTRKLTVETARFLYELHQKVLSLDCELHWEPKRNLIPRNCYLSAEVELSEPPVHIAHGTTTLQGRLLRIGGESPGITMELPSGQILDCRVTEKMALEIAPQLYQTIALHGRVSWEADEMTVRAFQPIDVTTYRKQSIRKSFEHLVATSNRRWKDVDAQGYVNELRGSNGEPS